MLLQSDNTVVQRAFVGMFHKLLQTFSVAQFYVQPQEGTVHLHSARQALLSPADCSEKFSQEGEVAMKCPSVLPPEHLESPALVYVITLGPKVTTENRLHAREQVDDFPGVQLTFAVHVSIGVRLCWVIQDYIYILV